MQTIGPLEVGEIKEVRFDFSTEAASATTLSAPTVTCVVLDGVDASPSAILSGSPTVSGKDVVQRIQPGVVGCTYKLHAFATDSSGLRHHIAAKMSVVAG